MGKILIVDDDIEICDTFSDILRHAGYDVYVVKSGTEAFRALRRVSPDVVLLDMNMPGVSGVLTLSFIRHVTRLAHIRIIIVSGHPELAANAKAVWGADLSLTKPVSPRQLLDAVGSYVS
jgi:DNA-binding response OmpR family regulator